MTLAKYISLVSLITGFVGSFLMIKGILKMTPDVIGEIGQTRLDYSLPVLENLASQRANTLTGFGLVLIAFFFQFFNTLFDFTSIQISSQCWVSSLYVIIFTGLILSISCSINHSIERNTKIESGKAIIRRYIKSKFTGGDAPNWKMVLPYLDSYAKKLLNIERKSSESDKDYVTRLAQFLEVDLTLFLNASE